MPISTIVDLLTCPVCTQPVDLTDRSVRCAQGHSFDLTRQGSLNLTNAAEPANADTVAMVGARFDFLARGHYQPIAAGLARAAASGHPVASPTILDCGAGTGYYLAAVLDHLPTARGIALDVSTAAGRRAAQAHPRAGAIVADAWKPLPLRTASCDVVLSVFAPRNAAEFGRVLTPEGVLLTVTPTPDHLAELRAPLGLLEVDPDKGRRLADQLGAQFVHRDVDTVSYQLDLDQRDVVEAVGMGPNAFHSSESRAAAIAALPTPTSVTVAVEITRWQPARSVESDPSAQV